MTNKILWTPPISLVENSNMFEFQKVVNQKYSISIKSYLDLHKWSVDNIDSFWKEVWDYSQIIYSQSYSDVIESKKNIWETNWFLNSKLNYAENLLRYKNDNIAIYFFGENKAWIQNECTTVPTPRRSEITPILQSLYKLITELLPDEYYIDVPNHSQRLMKK